MPLTIYFLDVGHGDSSYVDLPNGCRMLIDCGCGPHHWPSRLLEHHGLRDSPVPTEHGTFGLDTLVITHPHGDHLADIVNIHNNVGFYCLVGDYSSFIDQIAIESIDFKRRGQEAAKAFVDIVKSYTAVMSPDKDRSRGAPPSCVVEKERFIDFTPGMDLNELSMFVSITYKGQKVLFTGDMTAVGVRRILKSNRAERFKQFVSGTTILKVPHHGRENGCSQEMFDLFNGKPIACIASDEVLNERNEGTSNINWYCNRTSNDAVWVNDSWQSRKVFTTRQDKDIKLIIGDDGFMQFHTNVFRDLRRALLGQ